MKLLVFPVIITLLSFSLPIHGLRISGKVKGLSFNRKPKWRAYSEFLGKFGVKKDMPLFVYGSSERQSNASYQPSNMLLVVAPRSKWNEFVQLSEKLIDEQLHIIDACSRSLLKPFNSNCTSSGNPYYRGFPCDDVQCKNQPNTLLPPNSKFVFSISPKRTEYYYIFLIYCGRNYSDLSCEWEMSKPVNFKYSISVTTDPGNHHDPFTFEFPANLEGLLISYLLFSLLYTLLVPGHLLSHFNCCCGARRYKRKTHLLVWLFSAALMLEALSMLCGLIHFSVYSVDGQGVSVIFYMKDFFNLIGNWCLILVLILVSGGWQVTVKSIKWKFASFPIWLIYVASAIMYYIWEVIYLELYPYKVKDPLQEWAGGIYLAIRSLLLFYVWYQIYHIYQQEESPHKLRLYKILFVLFTIWFWYLPLLVLILTFTPPPATGVVVTNFSTTVNFLVILIMAILFFPRWSGKYFQFDSDASSAHLMEGQWKLQYSKMADKSTEVI